MYTLNKNVHLLKQLKIPYLIEDKTKVYDNANEMNDATKVP